MKRKLCIFLILILTLSFGMVSAQAATVTDRVVILEQAIGLEAGTDALIARIAYLEAQLGVIAAAGATIEDRIAALEAILGVAPAAEEAANPLDKVVYGEADNLIDFDYFSMDGEVEIGKPGYTGCETDNYGNNYATRIYPDDLSCAIEYRLDDDYKAFTGTIYVNAKATREGKNHYWDNASVSIYGDDVLLYQTTGFEPKSEPLPIAVDVDGVTFLKIVFNQAVYTYSTNYEKPLVVLGNPAVVK